MAPQLRRSTSRGILHHGLRLLRGTAPERLRVGPFLLGGQPVRLSSSIQLPNISPFAFSPPFFPPLRWESDAISKLSHLHFLTPHHQEALTTTLTEWFL